MSQGGYTTPSTGTRSSPDELAEPSRGRLIRVRVSKDFGTIFPAATTNLPELGPTVKFGRWFASMRSLIRTTSLSRDNLYFDEELPLAMLACFGVVRGEIEDPEGATSPIPRVSLKVGMYDSVSLLHILLGAVGSESLEEVFLVCDGDKLRELVKDVPSDDWGFREIEAAKVKEIDANMYRLIMETIDILDLPYKVVIEWED